MAFYHSFLAALIPMLIYLILIWKLDKYEREPFRYVIMHFLWGAIGAIFFALIGSYFLNSVFISPFNNEYQDTIISAILIAPFVEELTKGIYLIKTFNKSYFDNITDGLVYGGAIGLGFGMTENFMYFLTNSDNINSWISIVIIRSVFSAVMHGIATATLGAMLAKSKFTKSLLKYFLPVLGLILAMIFHSLWNLLVSFEFTFIIGFIFMIGLIYVFFKIFNYSLKYEQKILKEELSKEFNNLSLPYSHVEIISSKKRFNKNWIDKNIRSKYINLATKLAFRKYQLRNCPPAKKENYLLEIEQLRMNLLNLMKSNNA